MLEVIDLVAALSTLNHKYRTVIRAHQTLIREESGKYQLHLLSSITTVIFKIMSKSCVRREKYVKDNRGISFPFPSFEFHFIHSINLRPFSLLFRKKFIIVLVSNRHCPSWLVTFPPEGVCSGSRRGCEPRRWRITQGIVRLSNIMPPKWHVVTWLG